MRHDWIFDVLKDLRSYAQSNGLPALALKADEAMRVARAEVAACPTPDPAAEGGPDPDEAIPPPGLAH
jgi:hypothetical protein